MAALDALAVGRARESDSACADELLDAVGPHELLERVDLLGRADHLEDERLRPEVGVQRETAEEEPRTIAPERLAVEAVEIMERNKVNQLLVVDIEGKLVGALNMHDLFRAKVV